MITAISICPFLEVNFSGLVTEVVARGTKCSDTTLQVPVGKTPGFENESTNTFSN